MNKFQQFNNNLYRFIFVTLNNKLERLFASLTKAMLMLIGVALMLASSIPIFYILWVLISRGEYTFDIITFLKYILVGIVCWYTGLSLSFMVNPAMRKNRPDA